MMSCSRGTGASAGVSYLGLFATPHSGTPAHVVQRSRSELPSPRPESVTERWTASTYAPELACDQSTSSTTDVSDPSVLHESRRVVHVLIGRRTDLVPMKLVEKLEASDGPFYTFEFFPPRTDQVSADLTVTRRSFDPGMLDRASTTFCCAYPASQSSSRSLSTSHGGRGARPGIGPSSWRH